MFPLTDIISLRGLRNSGLVDNTKINTKGTKRGLDKLERIIDMKYLKYSRILSENLRDGVGDHKDNLKAVAQKVDPTHKSVIINKHNIVAMIIP